MSSIHRAEMYSPAFSIYSAETDLNHSSRITPHSARYRRQSLKVCLNTDTVIHGNHVRSKTVPGGSDGFRHRRSSSSQEYEDTVPWERALSEDRAHDSDDDSLRKDDKMKVFKIEVVKKILDEFDLEQTLDAYKSTGKGSYSRNPMDYGHDM